MKIVNGKIDCDEEGEIDESLNGLQQDDPILIDAIKNYYLMSAATMPYKIQPKNLQPPAIYVSCSLKFLLRFLHTVWFGNFSVIHILHEINFGGSMSSKTCHF